MSDSLPKLLPLKEAAKRLSLSPKMIRKLFDDGEIEGVKVGKTRLIIEDRLPDFIAKHRNGKPPEEPTKVTPCSSDLVGPLPTSRRWLPATLDYSKPKENTFDYFVLLPAPARTTVPRAMERPQYDPGRNGWFASGHIRLTSGSREATEAEAVEKNDLLNAVIRVKEDGGRAAVWAVLNAWLSANIDRIAWTTLLSYHQNVLPFWTQFGHMPVGSIRMEHLAEFETRKWVRTSIRASLKWAGMNGIPIDTGLFKDIIWSDVHMSRRDRLELAGEPPEYMQKPPRVLKPRPTGRHKLPPVLTCREPQRKPSGGGYPPRPKPQVLVTGPQPEVADEAKLIERVANISKEGDRAPTWAVLTAWLRWLPTRREPRALSADTIRVYFNYLNAFCAVLGDVAVGDLRKAGVETWMKTLAAGKVKDPTTGRGFHLGQETCHRAALAVEAAIRWASTTGGILNSNPLEKG